MWLSVLLHRGLLFQRPIVEVAEPGLPLAAREQRRTDSVPASDRVVMSSRNLHAGLHDPPSAGVIPVVEADILLIVDDADRYPTAADPRFLRPAVPLKRILHAAYDSVLGDGQSDVDLGREEQ